MNRSIKTRLMKNFMLIIIITVVILEVVLINAIKTYYYKNLEYILDNQIDFSIDYYLRYFSAESIEDTILDDIDVFWQYTTAQVQILNPQGELLMDSLGVNNNVIYSDIQQAIQSGRGIWSGLVEYDSKPVMAISKIIGDSDNPIGMLRFVASLEETNKTIQTIAILIIGMGIMVVVLSGIVSFFLAKSIVSPLEEVTAVAEKMADGQLKVRSEVKVKDEIGKLSDTLNYMAEELVKKEQLKNDFISSVSHELRTPLTSIKGWAITLKSEDFNGNEIVLDGLDIIEKESDRLTNLVEELLDFSKFVSGRIKLEKELFQISSTLNMIAKQLKPKAVNNKINFNIEIDNDLGMILGDENRIKQVFINLLDNAFKFTDIDGKVTLRAYRDEKNIIVMVEDNGIGISEEDLPKVKEKFYKGKDSKSHSGIGLSISDEIVKLHNGTIDIYSEINQGTKVVVYLPLMEESV